MRTRMMAIAAILLFCTSCSAAPVVDTSWLVGSWEKIQDEDGPSKDVIRFNDDGTYVSFGPNCEERSLQYFVWNGNVFLMVDMPKGPVALVFRPDTTHQQMTFTSPRTLNNALYKKAESSSCRKS